MQPDSDVDRDACARDGVAVVRRPSGGRGVLHRDEVTYALVCRVDDPTFGGDVMTSCARIHNAVAEGLALLGVTTSAHAMPPEARRKARRAAADCFTRPSAHELVDAQQRKLVGSAQARHGRALLQHGSVLLLPSATARYLRPGAVRAPGDHRRTQPATPGLRALVGRDVSRDEVARALAAGFHQVLCAKPLDTTA
jgi:lipoate-protein ligase A